MFAKSGFLIGILAFAAPLSSWGQDAMTFEPVGVADEREQEAEIAEALKAYKRDDFLRASLILYRIAARNEQAISVYEQKAEYTLSTRFIPGIAGLLRSGCRGWFRPPLLSRYLQMALLSVSQDLR